MRRFSTLSIAVALLVAACSGTTTGDTTASTTTSLIVTTTSTVPPTTSVVPPTATAVAIEVWAPEAIADLVDDAGATFATDTGITVNVSTMSADETLAAVLADPSTGPDVFIGPHLWMTALTDAGIAEPLDRGSEVVAGALAAVTLRATVYAAPLGLDTVVQFRNTTGLAVAPASVESLSTGCPDGDGVGPCLLIPIESVDSHYPFLVALGGYVFGADEYEEWDVSDVGVDSDEAVAGVSILKLLADDDITLGDGNSSVVDRFVAGTAPLLWGTLDSKAALEAAGARFVVEQLPSIAEAAAISPVYVTAAWVNAFAPGKEAAARFVSGYLAAPEVGNAVALELGMAPVNIGYDDDAQLVPFIETARGGHPVPTVFQTPYAWEQLAVAFSQIRSGDDVSAALLEAAVAIRNAPTPEPPVEDEG